MAAASQVRYFSPSDNRLCQTPKTPGNLCLIIEMNCGVSEISGSRKIAELPFLSVASIAAR